MTAPKRYFFAASRKAGAKVHVVYSNNTAEGPTACGTFMRKGWSYWFGRHRLPGGYQLCKRGGCHVLRPA